MSSSSRHGDVAIVEPPPEIKFYVEKTAAFLSKTVMNMEKTIMTSTKDDPDFSFLKSSDPYHAYYKKVLTEYGGPGTDDDFEDPPAIRDVLPSLPPKFFERIEPPASDDDRPAIRDVPSLPLPPKGSHIQVTPPPSMGMMPLPEEPKPKLDESTFVPQDKFLDESTLVPQDKFLAQHPGLSTISVYVPNFNVGKVIEFTVQSLAETVGSLKEKISARYHHQITTDRLKLIGKTGYLKDSNSLAHYNVGAGENLTLEMENIVQSREALINLLLKKNAD